MAKRSGSIEKEKDTLASVLATSEYKVIIIGGLGVGKTSILLRYVHDTFEDRVSRFVAEEKKTVSVDGYEVVLDIWDTAGQERFQSITNRFYSDTQAVIIVYDITAEDSLHDIDFWIREVQYYLLRELEDGMPIIFVGNKKDLVQKKKNSHGYPDEAKDSAAVFRQVQELSNANGYLRPLECSAKSGENVNRIFNTIAHELIRRKTARPNPGLPKVVNSRRMCSDIC